MTDDQTFDEPPSHTNGIDVKAERLVKRSRWLLPIAGLLVFLSALAIVVSVIAIRAHQDAESVAANELCAAVDDIHRSLVAFVREHHRITVDLREVGIFHQQVPLRKTLRPLDVECAERDTREIEIGQGHH